MSQDNQHCPKCSKPSGYDSEKGYWPGGNLRICGMCKKNLIRRFCAFFGLDGASYSDMGLEIGWSEVDRILSRIRRDYERQASYIVTDKAFWEKTMRQEVPTEEA